MPSAPVMTMPFDELMLMPAMVGDTNTNTTSISAIDCFIFGKKEFNPVVMLSKLLPQSGLSAKSC
jgi:hypothetical protein